MDIGVLDHSARMQGQTSREALLQTLNRVEYAEALGYERYWFSEHHGAPEFRGTSPEMYASHASARTSRIRLGPGGILLQHQTAIRAFESLELLTSMLPGRLDFGLARGQGADSHTSQQMQMETTIQPYVEKVDQILAMYHEQLATFLPTLEEKPQLWMLGSGSQSAQLAAKRGCCFAAAHMLSGESAVAALHLYLDTFQPTWLRSSPRANIAVFALAAESFAEARRHSETYRLWLRLNQASQTAYFAAPESAATQDLADSPLEKLIIHGTAADVHEQLSALQYRTRADGILINTICSDHNLQLDSLAMIAEQFHLKQCIM